MVGFSKEIYFVCSRNDSLYKKQEMAMFETQGKWNFTQKWFIHRKTDGNKTFPVTENADETF